MQKIFSLTTNSIKPKVQLQSGHHCIIDEPKISPVMQSSLKLKSLTMRKQKFSILRASGVANKNQPNRWKFPRGETFRPLVWFLCNLCNSTFACYRCEKISIRWLENSLLQPLFTQCNNLQFMLHVMLSRYRHCLTKMCTRTILDSAGCCCSKIWRAMSKKKLQLHRTRFARLLCSIKNFNDIKEKKLLFSRSFFNAAASRNKKNAKIFHNFFGVEVSPERGSRRVCMCN